MDLVLATLVFLILVITLVLFVTLTKGDSEKYTIDPNAVYVPPVNVGTYIPDKNYHRSVNLMELSHDNPIFSKYTMRQNDVMGLDGADYYLENDMLYKDGVIEKRHGTAQFQAINPIKGQRGNDFQFFQDMYSDLPYGLDQSDLPIGNPNAHGSVESAEPFV